MSIDAVRKISRACLEAEFGTLEITMNTTGSTDMISSIREEFPGLNVGAGTVCNKQDLKQALWAGAQFIVTPILDEAVIKDAVSQGVPIFPGAFSPTEIYRAWSLGASAVKVFPASQFGVNYIKEVRGPLDDIKLLPTGGVSLENIRSFFEAGAFGVGMGSSLFKKELVEADDINSLIDHLQKFKTALQSPND